MSLRASIVRLLATNIGLLLVSLAVIPVLTRLVSPMEWGRYQLMVNLAVVAASVLFLQMDMAYMVTTGRQARRLIAAAVMPVGVAMLLAGMVAVALLIVGSDTYGAWALLVLPAALGLSFYQMHQIAQAKNGNYKGYAWTKVGVQVGQNICLLLMGWLSCGATGLFIAWSLPLIPLSMAFYRQHIYRKLWRHAWKVVRRHGKTAGYGTASVLFNNARSLIPLMMLFTISDPHEYGVFMLAVRVLDIPVSIAGVALQHVLMPTLAQLWSKQRQEAVRFYVKWMLVLLALAAVGGGMLILVPDSTYAFMFGNEWVGLGKWMLMISIWKLLEFVNAPLAPVSNLLSNQKWVAFLRIFYCGISILAMTLVDDFYSGVVVIIALSSAYYMTYLMLNAFQMLMGRKSKC